MDNYKRSKNEVIAEFETLFAQWQTGPKKYTNFLTQIESLDLLSKRHKLKNLEKSVGLIKANLPDASTEFIDIEVILEIFEDAILSDVPTIMKNVW